MPPKRSPSRSAPTRARRPLRSDGKRRRLRPLTCARSPPSSTGFAGRRSSTPRTSGRPASHMPRDSGGRRGRRRATKGRGAKRRLCTTREPARVELLELPFSAVPECLVWHRADLLVDRPPRGIVMAMSIYLALGDSISIDDYTGVRGGGAPSQLARKLGFDLVDLTRDGNTTRGVLADLAGAPPAAEVVTLT